MADSQPVLTEGVSGGLVTTKDPSMLREGELSECINAIYKPNSLSLHRAPGRSLFGTVAAASAINGLVDIKFDNGNHYLIAEVSGTRYRAPVGLTGTFASLDTSIASGTTLDSTHYDNKFYLFNGQHQNRVVYLAATATATTPSARNHGLLPVLSSPHCATAAGTASVTNPGYYQYWTTEVVKVAKDAADFFSATATGHASAIAQTVITGAPPAGVQAGDRITNGIFARNTTLVATAAGTFTVDAGVIATGLATATFERGNQEVLESTFGGDPSTLSYIPSIPTLVNIATTGVSVSIVRPAASATTAFNSTATHWRVYRSPKLDNLNDNQFPTGFLISNDIPIGTESWTDQGVQAAVTKSATDATSSSWSNPTRVTSSNNSYATVTGTGTYASYTLDAKAFVFSTVSDPVRGIEVLVENFSIGLGGVAILGVQISVDGGINWSNGKTASINVSETVYTMGASFDTWGLDIAASQINSPNFQVRLTAIISGRSVGVDHVQVKVYANAATQTSTDVFPAIIIETGGETAAVGSHGQPPVASTGDIFEDCLVTNDIAMPSFLRWSLPGEPEYFPWLYFFDFETADNDRVSCIKTLGNRLLAGLRTSLWRINYLPTEDDAKFNRGLAIDLISSTHGIVNARAAVLYVADSGRTQLAFVAPDGVFVTDGFTIKEASPDVSWSNIFATIDRFNAGNLFLENDSSKWELKLYVSDETKLVLYRLHYHPLHMKNGNMKVSGPHLVYHTTDAVTYGNPRSARVVVKSTGNSEVYVGYNGTAGLGGGNVYRETGFNIPVTNALALYDASVRGRRMYLAGLGNEAGLNDVYVHHQAPDTSAILQFFIDTSTTGAAEVTDSASDNFTCSFIGPSKIQPMVMAEAVRIRWTDATGSTSIIRDWTVDYLTLAGVGFERQT